MGKAIISNRIYLTKTPELFLDCRNELTYKIPSNRPNVPPEIICDISIISSSVFSIPVGRQDLIPKDYEIIDKRDFAPVNLPEFRATLRPDQIDVYNAVDDNCLINAKPGWGKTFVGIAIAKKLEQKTLVVVHNTALRDQWVDETKDVLGFTPGIIGTNKFQTHTDIVISNTQTLGKHIQKYAHMFGTVIVDECHRVPATTFKKIVDTSYARYKLGLSATLGRKDHKHILIPDYFSTKVHKPSVDTALVPTIYCIHSKLKLNEKIGHWANKVTDLAENPDYLELICNIAKIKTQVDKHKILLVADRVEFLSQCQEEIPNIKLVTGAVTNRQEIHRMILNNEVLGIAGTTSIYKEGMNIPPLSCLIIGSPLNNRWLLEQLIGRITRPYPGKLNPEVMDIVLQDKTSKRQFAERLNYYLSQGYKIIEVRDA